MRVTGAVAISISSLCVVAVMLIATYSMANGSGFRPVTGVEAEELGSALRLGCEDARLRVGTSAGSVVRHEWRWEASGELLETETTYRVASDRERFRALVETRQIKNEWSREGTPVTVHRLEMAYDGERVTKYEPHRQLAVIAGPDSAVARELQSIRIVALQPGTAVPDLDPGVPSDYRTPIEARVVGREIVNGDDCIVYESGVTYKLVKDASMVTSRNRIWVAPSKGFNIIRAEATFSGGPYGDGLCLARSEVSLRRYRDDIWGIRQVKEEQWDLDTRSGKYLARRSVCTFADDYQLNAP